MDGGEREEEERRKGSVEEERRKDARGEETREDGGMEVRKERDRKRRRRKRRKDGAKEKRMDTSLHSSFLFFILSLIHLFILAQVSCQLFFQLLITHSCF